MLPSKTVFVVGAGASKEVGLPIGSELKKTIADKLSFSFDDFGRDLKRGDLAVFRMLLNSYGNRINECVDAGRLISKGIVLSSSIDDFIDAHQHDEQIAVCGKVTIARSILEAERGSKLFYDQSNIYNTIDFASVDGTWFSGFFQLLSQQVRKSNLADLLTNVVI